MISAGRLDRRFYTELVFDSYATGNAVLVVALVYLILALAPFLLSGLLSFGYLVPILRVLLNGAIGWIVVSLVVWAVGAFLLDGDARLQTVIRLAGFAHVPLLALLVPVVGLWVGTLWFGAALMTTGETSLGLPRDRAIIAAAAGVLVWFLLFRPF